MRGQLVKRPGQRPFSSRVRWVHGFRAECQADWRDLGGLTDGSERQEVDDGGPEHKKNSKPIKYLSCQLDDLQAFFFLFFFTEIYQNMMRVEWCKTWLHQGGWIPTQEHLCFYNSVPIWLRYYTLFIPLLTWEAELGGSQASPKDLVTRGLNTEQNGDRQSQGKKERGGETEKEGRGLQWRRKKSQRRKRERCFSRKQKIKRRWRGKRGQKGRVTQSAKEVKVWLEEITFRFRDTVWLLTGCHSVFLAPWGRNGWFSLVSFTCLSAWQEDHRAPCCGAETVRQPCSSCTWHHPRSGLERA